MYVEAFGLSEVNTGSKSIWGCDLKSAALTSVQLLTPKSAQADALLWEKEKEVKKKKKQLQKEKYREDNRFGTEAWDVEITLTIGLTTATHQSKIPLWSLSAWTPLTACYKKRLTAQMTITQGCRGKCFPSQYSDSRRVTSRRSDRWASSCITSWTWRALTARSYSGTPAVIWAPLY